MRWMTLIMLFILYMINYADKSVAGYSAVHIMEEFSLTASQWGTVGSSFYWFFSLAGIIGAAMSDRIGTKKMLAIMALSWTVIQFGAYMITGLPLLILARVLLGIGEGPFWATVVSHLSKWFPEERRGLVFSIVNFGAFVGAVASAPLIVKIIESSGWRTSWAFLGGLSLIWFLFWFWLGREKPQGRAVIPSTTPTERQGNWSSALTVMLSASFIFSFFVYFAQTWGTTFAAVWEPVYLVKVIRLTPEQMSYAIAITGILAGVMTILISWIADSLFKRTRSYRKSYVLVGGISIILGGLFFYSVTIIHTTAWVLFAMCLAKGFAFSIGTQASVIASSLMPERRGLIVGVMASLVTIAGILSPIATGSIVEAAGENISLGFSNAMLLNATLFIVFGVLFMLFVKRKEQLKTIGGAIEQTTA